MASLTVSDVKLLAAAADATRLSILRQLSAEGPTCACDVTQDSTGLSQSTVSHHLKVLREAGWIKGERRGTWIWYSIREEAVDRFHQIGSSIRPGGARPTGTLGPARRTRRSLDVVQPEWRQW